MLQIRTTATMTAATQKRSMDNLKKRKPYKRSHAVTVCIVPPPPPARTKNDEKDFSATTTQKSVGHCVLDASTDERSGILSLATAYQFIISLCTIGYRIRFFVFETT